MLRRERGAVVREAGVSVDWKNHAGIDWSRGVVRLCLNPERRSAQCASRDRAALNNLVRRVIRASFGIAAGAATTRLLYDMGKLVSQQRLS